jgi:hypothetical protein
MPARALKPAEYDELRQKYKVGPSNFADFFERKDGGIYFNPKDELTAANDTYGQAQKNYRAGLLDQTDLPALFKKAAKDTNPNFGLSRSEIMARFDDPKYSDTNSSSYVDPNVRIAVADRERRGYHANVAEAADRAGQLFGKDVTARQFALEDAAGTLQGIQAAREKEADFARQAALKQMGGSGGGSGGGATTPKLSTTQFLQALANGVDPNDTQAVANALYGDKGTKNYEDFLKEVTLPDNMSVDPQRIYRDYQEAQQMIDAGMTDFSTIRSDPHNAPFAYLLKPKSASWIEQLVNNSVNTPGGQTGD